ncbi:MAG: PASTA domain-containing protein [Thiogranum sp.]
MSNTYRTRSCKRATGWRASLLLVAVYLFAGELLAANAVPEGKIGIIGDSIAAGTHSSEMCRNQDIVDCVQDLGGQHSRDWSYAGGRQSWSIASALGYLPERVVDASDDGEEWKDAFNQAVRVMADAEVETVFIGLGANDVCQARGHDYSGDLEIVASLIDETLNYLTSTLPSGGSIYWSGVPDVVQMRELMRNRDHNILFQTCQATWDLDGNDVKEGVAADACDHYFSNNFCESAGAQGQAVDLLVELLLDTWKDIEGVNEGPCGKVLNSGSTAQDRLEARNFTMDLNRLMAQKARDWSGRNGIDVHYNDRLFYASPTIQPHHISRFDCFHPSRSGQMKFAYEIWSGFNHGNEQIKGIFIDEFDSTDYCTQEYSDWGSCWVETNDDTVATSGDIQISGNVLSMRRGLKEISRAMDLQSVDQAWISFNRRRDNLDHLGDFVNFQISPDAGQTWNQLDHFVGEATDFGFHRGSYYDISQYATADTRIRFISSDVMGENDWLFFDNVKVNSWDSSAASQAAPVYGELLLDESWQAVDTPTTDSPPMVFVGVATDSAGGAGVAVVRNVGTDHFEAQLQELNETGGEVSAERVSYLVLQTGTYVMPDGSHWEVGSFDIGADGTWQSQLFKTPFTDRPFLFLSLQTANNAEFPVLQVRTVDAAGFEVASFQQATSSSTGLNETAAYLAIYSPGNSGTVRIADTDQSYRLRRELLDGAWTPVLDTFLRLRDGMSEDGRINAEMHDVIALGTQVFAQQVSNTGSDLAVPQQIVDGVRGANATPLEVIITQVNPDTWPLGSSSPVTTDLSMPTGFSYKDIDATTFLIQGEALGIDFDAQSGRLSIPFADLESNGLLFVGENRLLVTGELFDGTPFQATFTITVTGSVVPDVVGMNYAEAEDRIRLAGMAVGDVEEEETAAVPEGQVLRQSPAPASNVPSLTLVDLVIASAVAVSDNSAGDSISGGGGGGCSYGPGHGMDPVLPLVAGLSLLFLGLWRRQGQDPVGRG